MIQALLLFFIAFVLWRTYTRFGENEITGREFSVWVIFWFAVGVAVLVPKKTDLIAQWLGVERGADLLVYLSIVAIFFILFKIMVRQEKIERTNTKLTRFIALSENKEDVTEIKHE